MQKNRSLFRSALAALLSAVLLLPGAAFAEGTAQENDSDNFSISFPVDYDTYIRKGYGQEDYSTTADMIIDGRTASQRMGVLRFRYGQKGTESVKALAESANQVTLRMQVNQNNGAPDMVVYGIADDTMKNAWRDSGMNYDLAKSLGILNALDTEAVPRLATISMETVSAAELLYVDVTDYVKQEAAKAAEGEAGIFSFLICGENAFGSNDFFRIYSDNENGTSEIRLPTLFAYTNHVGYAMRDSMGLSIEKQHQVTEDFDLPAVIGEERGETFTSHVTWHSDTDSVIHLERDGDVYHAIVTRPSSSTFGDAAVVLTATVQNGEEKRTRSFRLYVTPQGVFSSQLSNYVTSSSKSQTNPNGTLYAYVNGSNRNCAFVKFDTSESAFRYSPRIVLRLKPYFMSGAFTLTMTPLDAETAQLCTEDMTWSSAQEAVNASSPYSVSFIQSPSQKDWVEWDVTDYVHSVGDCSAFRLDIASTGTSYCMFYGNRKKYLPQLKLYNYELISDPETSVKQAATELQAELDAMHSELSAVTGDISLPENTKFGTEVQWQALSENGEISEYLDSDGILLKQPSETEENVKVRLVGVVSREDYEGEPVTVCADAVVLRQLSDEEAVRYNLEHLELDTHVLTDSGSLPKGLCGAKIVWTAEPDDVLDISDGSYTAKNRGDRELSAELIAKISKGDAQTECKRFPVTILRDKGQNMIYSRRPLNGSAEMEKANDDKAETHYVSDNDFSMEFAFSSVKQINSALVLPYEGDNIREITVYGSEDGEAWNQLGVLKQLSGLSSLCFNTVSVNRVRFDISVSGRTGICEVGVYLQNTENEKRADDIVNDKQFPSLAGIPDKAVSSDFTLAAEVGGAQIRWLSSDENVIRIQEKSDSFTAVVTQSEKKRSVTLTAIASLNGEVAERSFTVTVNAAKKESGSGGGGGSGSGKYIGTGTVAAPPVQSDKDVLPTTKNLFRDMDAAPWAEEAVYALSERGIISGRTEEEFAPSDAVTREEFVKLLVLAAGISPQGKCDFSDTAENAWYCPYIAAAADVGLVKGMADGSFGVGEKITRQDAAVLLSRLLDYCGVSAEDGEISFLDGEDIAPYAQKAVGRLQSMGIFGGDENGRMHPKNSTSRAEAAKVIYLLGEKISEK